MSSVYFFYGDVSADTKFDGVFRDLKRTYYDLWPDRQPG